MTITEAAKTVKKSRQTIYNYIEQGKLKASRNGKGFEVELEDLLDAFEMSKNTSNKTNNVSSDNVSNQASNGLSNVDRYIDTMIEQLEEKDNQIKELHQLLAISEKNTSTLAEQNQLLLEDTRRKPSLFQRFKTIFAGA